MVDCGQPSPAASQLKAARTLLRDRQEDDPHHGESAGETESCHADEGGAIHGSDLLQAAGGAGEERAGASGPQHGPWRRPPDGRRAADCAGPACSRRLNSEAGPKSACSSGRDGLLAIERQRSGAGVPEQPVVLVDEAVALAREVPAHVGQDLVERLLPHVSEARRAGTRTGSHRRTHRRRPSCSPRCSRSSPLPRSGRGS